ncbi:hypothetical protein FGIG_08079 [Fasciola gigantica]|uniref:Uncharacterized protein n=1 Tax=Fasciola gigantica TaxID=46835 RepID=A0A504Z9L0_FASGI|nr:hypothetical protein FGIG_08079 [Fasciola gigantica]
MPVCCFQTVGKLLPLIYQSTRTRRICYGKKKPSSRLRRKSRSPPNLALLLIIRCRCDTQKEANAKAFVSFTSTVRETDAVKNVIITNEIEGESLSSQFHQALTKPEFFVFVWNICDL